MARPAEQIPLGEVVAIIEGPVTLGETQSGPGGRGPRKADDPAGDGQRVTDSIFEQLSDQISECLNAVSLADVCARADALGIRRPNSESYVYFI